MSKPTIAISMGDPAGVGPELCLHLLTDSQVAQNCTPLVFGDADLLKRVAVAVNIEFNFTVIDIGGAATPDFSELSEIETPTIIHIGALDAQAVDAGIVDANTGQASFDYIEAAIKAAHAEHVSAVVTGPINKEAWNAAGIAFPGHTELFADRCNTDRFCMMMYSPNFSCSLVTTHIGYAEVPDVITQDRIEEVIELSHNAIELIEQRAPNIAVLGLNPHAGEHGLFGNQEEENLIVPAMQALRTQGIKSIGPLPPDTGFLPKTRRATDVYICMYHDQGLIPFKAFNFDTGVNVTLGLPMVRTSVDHGTANDIAWQGIADPSSLFAAVKLAIKLA